MSPTPLIEAQRLGIGYPGHSVGRGISLTVSAGEVLCLLGPNGSGKTTLFKTLLGLLPEQAGEVLISGAPLESMSRQELARTVAYVPQAHNAQFPYTVFDMVLMGRTAHMGVFARPSEADRWAALASLDRLGIADLADSEYTRISGGQRQLALVARALAQEAPAVIMDEPTASLDFGNQVLVLSEISALASRGLAIVLSTHDPDHAFSIADRVLLLSDGGLVANGTPADVLKPERLREVYGVTVGIETLKSGQRVCAPDFGPRR